jgi:hypothetical protein
MILNKFHQPTITKAWLFKKDYQEWHYQIHLKTHDDKKHEHQFTILYEIKGPHGEQVELKKIHEGYHNFV